MTISDHKIPSQTSVEPPVIVTLLVVGELDLDTTRCLLDRVEHLDLAEDARVRLDLAGVGFLDVAGVRAVVQTVAMLSARGAQVEVVEVQDGPRRVFTLAGVDGVLDLSLDGV